MANIKITDLPELTGTPNDANLLEIVDKAGETPVSKKITWANIKAAVLTAVGKVNEAVGFTISGGTTIKTLTVEDTSVVNQDLTTDASPTFANITDSGLTASQAIFSDASKKLITKSAADTMTALVGSLTANYKCFVNAAGTGTEWAKGIGIISATRDMEAASGDVSYTGLGFKPSHVIAIVGMSNSTVGSIGVTDGTYQRVLFTGGFAAGYLWYTTNTQSISAYSSPTTSQYAVIKTLNSDGLTLTWTKGGSPSGTADITLLCFR